MQRRIWPRSAEPRPRSDQSWSIQSRTCRVLFGRFQAELGSHRSSVVQHWCRHRAKFGRFLAEADFGRNRPKSSQTCSTSIELGMIDKCLTDFHRLRPTSARTRLWPDRGRGWTPFDVLTQSCRRVGHTTHGASGTTHFEREQPLLALSVGVPPGRRGRWDPQNHLLPVAL